MEQGSINMKMGIISKATTSKIPRGEKESTFLVRGEFWSQSLTLAHLKFPKSTSPMDPCMLESKEMDHERGLAKQPMLMEASTMDNG